MAAYSVTEDSGLVQRKLHESVLLQIDKFLRPEVSRDAVMDVLNRVFTPTFEESISNFESSNILEFSYDGISRVLRVSFSTGSRYLYYGVEESTYKRFTESESKGKFFHTYVKSKYPSERVA